MSGRMPILCEDDIAEIFGKPVDDRHHLVAAWYGKGAVRTEVVLHVDDNKGVAVAGCVNCGSRASWFFLRVSRPCGQVKASRTRLSTYRSHSDFLRRVKYFNGGILPAAHNYNNEGIPIAWPASESRP